MISKQENLLLFFLSHPICIAAPTLRGIYLRGANACQQTSEVRQRSLFYIVFVFS